MTAPAHFEIHRSRRPGPARWLVRIVGANGEKVLTSQRFTSRQSALEAIAIVRAAADSPVRES